MLVDPAVTEEKMLIRTRREAESVARSFLVKLELFDVWSDPDRQKLVIGVMVLVVCSLFPNTVAEELFMAEVRSFVHELDIDFNQDEDPEEREQIAMMIAMDMARLIPRDSCRKAS